MFNSQIVKAIASFHEDVLNREAISDSGGNALKYCEIIDAVNDSRGFFASLDVKGSSRIAAVSREELDLALLFLVISEHAVHAPLDHNLTEDEFAYYYDLLKIDYVLVEKSYKGPALNGLEGLPGPGIIRYSLENGKADFFLERPLGSREKESCKSYVDEDTALLLTTSGTTSRPKIVPLSYENLLVSAYEKIEFFNFTERDVDLIVTPMYKGTSINSMTATLLSGGRVVITRGFNHYEFIRLLREEMLTWFTASPAILSSLIDHAKKYGLNLRSNTLRFARSSGAPLKAAIKEYLEKELDVPVIQTYGMTETRTIASTYGLKVYKEGSVGISLGNDIRIEDGEIVVRGKNVLKGYENDPEANSLSFSDGWFHTGDMGYVDRDGYVFITGRIKEMINRGGEKISPYEVEDAIVKHKNIRDAAVFPYPNSYGSEDAGAVIVLEDSKGEMNLAQLRNHLKGLVKAYKMPSLLYVVDRIPLSPSGKVQRKMLYEILDSLYPELASSAVEDESRFSPSLEDGARTDTEIILVDIWKDILNIRSIDTSDDFFDLGGDSLSAAALFSEIEERLGVQVPVAELFNNNTIEKLSALVDEYSQGSDGIGAYSFIVPMKKGGPRAPVFFIHPEDGEVVTYHKLVAFLGQDRPVYGLRFKADHGGWTHPVNFRQIGESYASEIMDLNPDGPYLLLGSCFGGLLAYHVALEVKRRGGEVSLLGMFDPLMNSLNKEKISMNYGKRFRYAFMDLSRGGLKNLPSILMKKSKSLVKLIGMKINLQIYDYMCRKKDIKHIKHVMKSAILKRARKISPMEAYEGKMVYFLPSLTAADSDFSIGYWQKMVSEVLVVKFQGSHYHYSDEESRDLADRIREILENLDD